VVKIVTKDVIFYSERKLIEELSVPFFLDGYQFVLFPPVLEIVLQILLLVLAYFSSFVELLQNREE
jgi:hypothetical protein